MNQAYTSINVDFVSVFRDRFADHLQLMCELITVKLGGEAIFEDKLSYLTKLVGLDSKTWITSFFHADTVRMDFEVV